MSETPQDPNTQGGEPDGGAPEKPSMTLIAQYLKDLSFESPRALESFQPNAAPEIDINVDVNGKAVAPNQYEIEFSVSARATRNEEPVFIVEATYAGAFEIKNLTREQLEIAMLVECPRMLFPFMRQIIADATRNGNFPPLMLDPIDFMSIYIANKDTMRRPAAGQA